MKKIKLISLNLIIFIFVGCVGTIDSSLRPVTQTTEPTVFNFNYAGIVEANAIAHDKAEVYFPDVGEGSGDYTFTVYQGNDFTGRTFLSSNLSLNLSNRFRVRITGLERSTKYIFRVEATDNITGVEYRSPSTIEVETFDHLVADFGEIQSVSNRSGEAGLTSLRVDISPALVDPNTVTPPEGQPVRYLVEAVDVGSLSVDTALYDDSIPLSSGRIIQFFDFVPDQRSLILTGLDPGTDYIVGVRAIHAESSLDPSDPSLESEQNRNYIFATTLSAGSANFIPDNDIILVEKGEGDLAQNSVTASWENITGAFNHLRLFYGPELGSPAPAPGLGNIGSYMGGCSSEANMTSIAGIFCKKLESDVRSTTLTDLIPETVYDFRLMICGDFECIDRNILPIVQQNTNPIIGEFDGLLSVTAATDLSELGKAFLNFSMLNENIGSFDGIEVFYGENSNFFTNSPVPLSDAGSEQLIVSPFDINTDTTIVVNNVNYSSTFPQCFALARFNFNLSLFPFISRDYFAEDTGQNYKVRCLDRTLAPITAEDFPGLTFASTDNTSILLEWDRLDVGVFSDYEIFVLPLSASSFEFATAVADYRFPFNPLTEYERHFVSRFDVGVGSSGSYRLENLEDGFYKIGILTHFQGSFSDPFRSEANTNVFTCNVMAGSIPTICTSP